MKGILFSILIFILGLIVVEVVLRIINSDMRNYDIEMWKYARDLKVPDKVLGHVHRPNSEAILQNVEIKLNSRGMRSDEIVPGKTNMVFLGASFTLGWGVSENEAYPSQIGSYLKKQSSGYQVLNSATGNYNAYNYITNFLLHQGDLKPKYLVVNYFLNDAELLPEPSDNILLRNSQLAATLVLTVRKLLAEKNEGLRNYYTDLYQADSPGYIKMKKAMADLASYAKTNDTKVYFVMIPEMHFLKEYPFFPIHSKMKTLAGELGFEYHDLFPVLKGMDITEIQVMEGDSHPNARIHTLIADDLIDTILSKQE